MDFNDRFNSDHLVISPDLLVLMRRIMNEHEQEFKALIGKTFLHKKSTIDDVDPQDAQLIILDFFALMEDLLEQVRQEQEVAHHMQKQLMPSIDHIDHTGCDEHTVNSSAQRATDQVRNNPQANPQELLFKELLRHWKPSKKTTNH